MSRLLTDEQIRQILIRQPYLSEEELFNLSPRETREAHHQVAQAQDKETAQNIFNKIEQLASPRGACHYHSLEKFIKSREYKKLKEGR